MFLYLVQHGKANDKTIDPQRGLSDKGKVEVEAIAKGLSGKIKIEQIIHSPKERAIQTAEIFYDFLEGDHVMEEDEDLTPTCDAHIWRDRLKLESKNLMLVGHLPHLNHLLSLLLFHDLESEVLNVHNAGVICLVRNSDGEWRIDWASTPMQFQ